MNAALKLAFDMTAPRFHCPLTLVAGITIELPEATYHHAIRVRRLRIGDALTLFSGDGHEALARSRRIETSRASASWPSPENRVSASPIRSRRTRTAW